MEIEQTSYMVRAAVTDQAVAPHSRAMPVAHGRSRLGARVFRITFLAAALWLMAAAAIPAGEFRTRQFAVAVAGQSFELIAWERAALSQKLGALVRPPAAQVDAQSGVRLVRAYLSRAARIAALERELVWRQSQGGETGTGTPAGASAFAGRSTLYLQGQLAAERAAQEQVRPAVEQVLERQIGDALLANGFGVAGTIWPPVQFTFTEPPKKLVVSRRDQIGTVYSRMLRAGMPLADIEEAEALIAAQPNAVGYVTDIGGLGAYPSIVIDRAGLRWILSTIAHEWVHNYLSFFPLGLNYFASPELTAINETVAEIVGDEIGDWVYVHVYGEEIPPAPPVSEMIEPVVEPEVFDFRAEMRKTRLEVDRLLDAGEVDAAEAYMASRRLEFVANGYPLRVLNQAYFAFHGSYGSSPASSSPIGPALERLRGRLSDLPEFLRTVRGYTSLRDLEQAVGPLE